MGSESESITRQERINVILGVQKRLGCPSRAIDGPGHGKAINRIRNGGKGISDEKLESLYHVALELESARKHRIDSVYQVIRNLKKPEKKKVWTAEDIRRGIEKSGRWLERAVVVIVREELYANGWERFRLSVNARYIKYGGHLSEQEAKKVRKAISEESLKGLAEIANR